MATLRARASRFVNLTAQRGLALSPYVLAAELDPVAVPYGTSMAEVISQYLPDGIIFDLSNGETLDVDVSWGDIDYDPEIHGDHIFVASYELPDWVWQRKPQIIIKAVVTPIILDAEPLPEIQTAYNAPIGNISLPTQATVILTDETTRTVNIASWDTSNYNQTTHGEQIITTTDYPMPAGVLGEKYALTAKIDVKPVAISASASLSEAPCLPDIPLSTVLAALPNAITLVLSNGSVQQEVNQWTNASYNQNQEGTYNFTADYDLPAGVMGSKPAVEIAVTVQEWDYQVFKTVGTTTFMPPIGLTTLDILVVAGGGGAGIHPTETSTESGAGGAGGLIKHPNFTTNQQTYSVTVGGGGAASDSRDIAGGNGGNSAFGTLTALGGGGGGSTGTPSARNGRSGGCGGGGARWFHVVGTGGTGLQPSQSGDSGTYGFGRNGAHASSSSPGCGGSAGADSTTSLPGSGLTYYGVVFSRGGFVRLTSGFDGAPNTGNGGSTRGATDGSINGNGGSGIVVIRRPDFPENQVDLQM